MNANEFHNRFSKHEEKSIGEYHSEFAENVYDRLIIDLSTDDISLNEIRKKVIKYLDAEYGVE